MTCTDTGAISESIRVLTGVVIGSMSLYEDDRLGMHEREMLESVLEDRTMLNQVRVLTCIHTCIHTCMHTYISVLEDRTMLNQVRVLLCIHTCIHTYMHACMHACMHTYIHKCAGR